MSIGGWDEIDNVHQVSAVVVQTLVLAFRPSYIALPPDPNGELGDAIRGGLAGLDRPLTAADRLRGGGCILAHRVRPLCFQLLLSLFIYVFFLVIYLLLSSFTNSFPCS